MNHGDDGRFFQPHDDGIRQSSGRRYSQRLPAKTPFTEEMVRGKNGNDRFLALLRNDGDLHVAFLNVEDRVGRVSLRKHVLALTVLTKAPARADPCEKRLRIERRSL